jgi:DNA-binding NarL/FixJ family response regulator
MAESDDRDCSKGEVAQIEGDDSQMLKRVLLADDHPVVRKTLRALLTEVSVGICGEAENGRQAIDKAGELQPDVVVLDLVMLEMNGLEAAYEIRQRAPSAKIMLLSLHYSPQDGLDLANALGADAFVHKSALANDLVPTIGRLLWAKLGKRKAVLTS